MVLFEILRYSFSSMIWGILIAFFCVALFVFLIKGWYKDATFSPISYIIGFLLFILLSVQCILIVGSLKIIDMTDEYEQKINLIVESVNSTTEKVTSEQASDVMDAIFNKYPFLKEYIGGYEYSGYTYRELPHVIAQDIRSSMRWYIFRRILWCLGYVLLGVTCVIKTMSKTKHNKTSSLHRSTVYDDF